MKTFDVYYHLLRGFEVVKKGFSWPGFLFNVIWAFIKKLPRVGLGLSITIIMLKVISAIVLGDPNIKLKYSFVANGIYFAVAFCLCLLVGLRGNRWIGNKLLETRYHHLGSYEAESAKQAILQAEPAAKSYREESEEKDRNESIQCPSCGKFGVYSGYIEDGSMGDWCPNCKKSLKKIRGEI
jgi:hypothetical protein